MKIQTIGDKIRARERATIREHLKHISNNELTCVTTYPANTKKIRRWAITEIFKRSNQ